MEKHTEQPQYANAGRRGETKEYKESVYHVLRASGCVSVHSFFQVRCQVIFKTEIPFSIGDLYSLPHTRIYAQAKFALREFHHDPIDTEYAHEYSGFGRMYVCVRISVVGLGVRPCEGE